MSMAEDIAAIKWAIEQFGNTSGLAETIDSVYDKLRYDIEPKLDMALNGAESTAPAATKTVPWEEQLRCIRIAVNCIQQKKLIESIKYIRSGTGAPLQEAKETAEYIQRLIEIKSDPERMCWVIREIAIQTAVGDKEEARRRYKELTNCNDDQAAETVDFIEKYCTKKEAE